MIKFHNYLKTMKTSKLLPNPREILARSQQLKAKTLFVYFCALAGATLMSVSAQTTELLTNGGFENEPNYGINGDGGFTLLTGNQIPGWTIVPGHGVTVHNTTLYPTISGNYSVNTDGEGFNGHNADFYQDFSTTSGQSYAFSFDWQGWMNNAPATQLHVSIVDLTTTTLLYNGLFSYSAALNHESQVILGTGHVFRLEIQETPESGFNDDQFIVDNFSVTTASQCTPPPSGMVSWWPGDGNANDIQDGNNGALQNGATFAPGLVGQAFSFDDSMNQFVQVPDAPNIRFGPNSPMSVDFWIFRTSASTLQHFIGKRVSCTGAQDMTFQMGMGPGCGVSFGAAPTFICSGMDVPMNTWTHLAGTFDGTTQCLYINGQLVGSLTLPLGPANTAPLLIGESASCASTGGRIDEVEIFNRALSQTEIQAIVDAGSFGKCKGPQPTAAVSRKTHGAAGTFDIALTGNGIECRSGGATNGYQMIIDFMNPVTVDSASVTSGTGTVSSFSVNGSEVTVNLTGVINIQRITMTLHNVNDGTHMGDVPVSMGVLIGDVNSNATVNAADVAQTKARLGQTVDATNFRSDVNTNGSINAADTAIVKQNSGTSLPP